MSHADNADGREEAMIDDGLRRKESLGQVSSTHSQVVEDSNREIMTQRERNARMR